MYSCLIIALSPSNMQPNFRAGLRIAVLLAGRGRSKGTLQEGTLRQAVLAEARAGAHRPETALPAETALAAGRKAGAAAWPDLACFVFCFGDVCVFWFRCYLLSFFRFPHFQNLKQANRGFSFSRASDPSAPGSRKKSRSRSRRRSRSRSSLAEVVWWPRAQNPLVDEG